MTFMLSWDILGLSA
uniref:Uncharacterized protein n=1 Tax=Anguilla anguilla TaxID=7936 RepID=A0A0E9QGA7_ANGAN